MDKPSNSLSIYSVIEKITFATVDDQSDLSHLPASGGKPWLHIRMTAVWRRDVTEAGTTFEHQTVAVIPGLDEPRIITDGSFVFKHDLHRFIAEMGGFPITTEGILRVEHKIRELGQDEWLSQTYEIPVARMSLTNKPASDD